MDEVRIIIADSSSTFNSNIKRYLEERGFNVGVAEDGHEALRLIRVIKPHLIVLDLLLPKMNALAVLGQLRDLEPEIATQAKVIIASNQGSIDNIKKCLAAGAVDYLLKPIGLEDFVARLTFHLQKQKQIQDKHKDPSNLYLYLLELVLKQTQAATDRKDMLLKMSHIAAMALKSVRCSIIECDSSANTGIVRASSDDPSKERWPLDLLKYPEVMFVLTTGKTVAVENIDADPVLCKIKGSFNNIRFNSLIVAPIYNGHKLWGVISVRLPPGRSKILNVEIRFTQLVALVASLGLRLFNNSITEGPNQVNNA